MPAALDCRAQHVAFQLLLQSIDACITIISALRDDRHEVSQSNKSICATNKARMGLKGLFRIGRQKDGVAASSGSAGTLSFLTAFFSSSHPQPETRTNEHRHSFNRHKVDRRRADT